MSDRPSHPPHPATGHADGPEAHDADHGLHHPHAHRPAHDGGPEPARVHAHAHGHGHGHAHVHAGPPPNADRAFLLGIVLNLGFVAVEAGFGWYVDSLALIADAGHNLSDVAGLVLAWAGAWAARRRPDARHTYGWKRASILAALGNALLLLLAMGALGWEALGRLLVADAAVREQGWTIVAVAALGIVVNTATALLFLRGREHDLNLRGAFLHMAADALVSAGVVLAGLLVLWRGWTWIDPVTSLLIVGVIVWGTWGLLRESLNLAFDGVPAHIDPRAVRAMLAGLPGVAAVEDLHIWAMGTTEPALTAHLIMPDGPGDDAFLAHAMAQLHERFGIAHVTLQTVRQPQPGYCEPPR